MIIMVSLMLKMLDSLFLWHKYAVHRVSIFGVRPTQVVLNAVAKVLLCSGRMPEALAFYRDAEVGGSEGS